jgi:outer membrane biogenesis lipoprotein LolB
LKTLSAITVLALLAACSSPQDKAAKAQKNAYERQEEVANKRLELTEKYQKCVKDAGADQQKAAACDSYLKAAEALR